MKREGWVIARVEREGKRSDSEFKYAPPVLIEPPNAFISENARGTGAETRMNSFGFRISSEPNPNLMREPKWEQRDLNEVESF